VAFVEVDETLADGVAASRGGEFSGCPCPLAGSVVGAATAAAVLGALAMEAVDGWLDGTKASVSRGEAGAGCGAAKGATVVGGCGTTAVVEAEAGAPAAGGLADASDELCGWAG
jgi:hypothetical protein